MGDTERSRVNVLNRVITGQIRGHIQGDHHGSIRKPRPPPKDKDKDKPAQPAVELFANDGNFMERFLMLQGKKGTYIVCGNFNKYFGICAY